MKLLDYDNFFLPSKNLESSRAFYAMLGFDVKFDFSDKGMLAFSIPGQEPAIILKDISKFADASPAIWFVVEDVRAVCEDLRCNGVVLLREPFEIRTGLAAEFADPSGNRLGITDYSRRGG